jgi:hypothetical protein
VQAREELGEDEEQEVDEEEVEVEGREGAEHERRPHFIAFFRADTKAAQADEAMRSSLRAEHLLQQRHTGAPAAAARITHLLPWQIVVVLERRRQDWRSRSSLARFCFGFAYRWTRRPPARNGAHRSNADGWLAWPRKHKAYSFHKAGGGWACMGPNVI